MLHRCDFHCLSPALLVSGFNPNGIIYCGDGSLDQPACLSASSWQCKLGSGHLVILQKGITENPKVNHHLTWVHQTAFATFCLDVQSKSASHPVRFGQTCSNKHIAHWWTHAPGGAYCHVNPAVSSSTHEAWGQDSVEPKAAASAGQSSFCKWLVRPSRF